MGQAVPCVSTPTTDTEKGIYLLKKGISINNDDLNGIDLDLMKLRSLNTNQEEETDPNFNQMEDSSFDEDNSDDDFPKGSIKSYQSS